MLETIYFKIDIFLHFFLFQFSFLCKQETSTSQPIYIFHYFAQLYGLDLINLYSPHISSLYQDQSFQYQKHTHWSKFILPSFQVYITPQAPLYPFLLQFLYFSSILATKATILYTYSYLHQF